LLRLPETCYQLYVRPGDVVFLAKQQLHKLEVDPRTPNAVQTVFTLWTDKLAMQSAKPSQYNDKDAKVNAQGGRYGDALYAASARGHEAIVKLLLDKGAEVNAQGGQYGNALQAASARGHEAIVKLLLDKGADARVEAQ
jgi:hypothetical protein